MTQHRMTAKERLISKICHDPVTQCWNFTGALNRGYGQLTLKPRTSTRAHRLAYELYVGPIPENHQLHHICENKRCCNPHHLIAVTDAEHRRVDRMSMLNKTHCKRGHPLSGDNLSAPRLESGRRFCKQCGAIRQAQYRSKNPEETRSYQRQAMKQYRDKNPEHCAAYREAYRTKAKEATRRYRERQKAKALAAVPT